MTFDPVNGLKVADLLTLVGMAVVLSIIVELLKRTLGWTDGFTKRFAPLVACGCGLVLGTLAAIYLGAEIVQGALTGFLAGALAAGLYDGVLAAIAATVGKLPTRGAQ